MALNRIVSPLPLVFCILYMEPYEQKLAYVICTSNKQMTADIEGFLMIV